HPFEPGAIAMNRDMHRSAQQPPSRIVTLLVVGFVCFATVLSAQAANLSFLHDSAMSEFNDEDVRLLTDAFNAVVADQKTPVSRKWKNDASGNSGELRALAAFPGPKGEACKRVRITNQAKKYSGKATYTVCKMPEGWQLVPSDYAPMPPPKKK